jgi:hypothetical protein
MELALRTRKADRPWWDFLESDRDWAATEFMRIDSDAIMPDTFWHSQLYPPPEFKIVLSSD